MPADQGEFRELEFGDGQILVLSGRVVEYFRQDMPAVEGGWRWHVKHLAVETKPRRDGGLKLKLGRERDGGVWAGASAEVSPEEADAVMAFFETAKKERDK